MDPAQTQRIHELFRLVRPVLDKEGQDLKVYVDYPDATVAVGIWQVQVGRVSLFLLDTNLDENRAEDRAITNQLYGGDEEVRIRQEILLGIGGLRALDALGRRPTVCHMNEGYAAFLALERIRVLMAEQGLDFASARELTSSANVFTTHTPVPAGHDVFAPALVERYLDSYAAEMGIQVESLLDLGRLRPGDSNEGFNMTVLGLRLASHRNGVSRLHGEVSRDMWQAHWPGLPESEIPISSITNGIHVHSWISSLMRELLERHIDPRQLEEPRDRAAWGRVGEIPSAEIWGVHEERRRHLVNFVRRRLRQQSERHGATAAEAARLDEVLDDKALTIGFARRFATYKRATLLLQDSDRLARLLCNPDRPVQVIFAGKAHPHDNWGKELIRDIVHLSKREDLRGRIVFVADYDMSVARYLVQACDVWLNTPLRPMEASGTSGMKAMVNGALNLSTLDGWWAEAFEIDSGWAIGRGEEYDDRSHQDHVEADALYEVLETEVVPLFYDRDGEGLPLSWIDRMKATMSVLGPEFNTHRMVAEYTEKFYLPSGSRYAALSRDNNAAARSLGQWMAHLQESWREVEITEVKADKDKALYVGDEIEVHANVQLGALGAEDVLVELYHGLVDGRGEIAAGETRQMHQVSHDPGNCAQTFTGRIPCEVSGRRGFTVRVLPNHRDMGDPRESRLITWA